MILNKNTHTRVRNYAHMGQAAFLGIAIGAAITLLVAPKSGKKTRKWIKNKVKNVVNRADTDFTDASSNEGFEATSDKPDTKTKNNPVNKKDSIRNQEVDKSLAMVNHLKHTKHNDSTNTEPV